MPDSTHQHTALRSALSSVPWFDPEDAFAALAPHVFQNDTGQWCVHTVPSSSALIAEIAPNQQAGVSDALTHASAPDATSSVKPSAGEVPAAPAPASSTTSTPPAAAPAPANYPLANLAALAVQPAVPLEHAVTDLARRKPHWVRAQLTPGTGAAGSPAFGAPHNSAQRYANAGSAGTSIPLSYAELLKPENGPLLREYLHTRPGDLARLRQAHFGSW